MSPTFPIRCIALEPMSNIFLMEKARRSGDEKCSIVQAGTVPAAWAVRRRKQDLVKTSILQRDEAKREFIVPLAIEGVPDRLSVIICQLFELLARVFEANTRCSEMLWGYEEGKMEIFTRSDTFPRIKSTTPRLQLSQYQICHLLCHGVQASRSEQVSWATGIAC